MKVRTLLLLTLLGMSIAGLSLWAMNARSGSLVSMTSPIVLHYQLGLVVDGPSPNLTVALYSQSMLTGVTVRHVRLHAPLIGLFLTPGLIIAAMVGDALPRRRKPARTP